MAPAPFGHASGAGLLRLGPPSHSPQHARCLRAPSAAHGAAGVRSGVGLGARATRVPLLVSAYAASEQLFKKSPSLISKEERSIRKNFKQVQNKINSFPRVDNRKMMQATIQHGKEDFADGFNKMASMFSAEDVEQSTAKTAIDKVTGAIRQSTLLKVTRTHSGGSFGRRTLVTGAFDVDLIVYVKQYNGCGMTDPDTWRYDSDLVTDMRRHVVATLEAANSAWDVRVPGNAHYCDVLQVTVRGVPVDLLLVPDCARGKPGDPAWEQHVALMTEVYDNPAAAEYDHIRERADAAAFTRYVEGVHDDVKGVVRYVKALYKYGILLDTADTPKGGGGSWWPPEDDRIRSVSLEVLVLAADQRLRQRKYRGGTPASGNMYKLELFIEFLELVVAAVEEGEVVKVRAKKWGFDGDVYDFAHCWEGDAVRIIHPIDPTCNLERPREHRGPPNWRPLVELARSILDLMKRGGTFEEFRAIRAVQVPLLAMNEKLFAQTVAGLFL
ncbi:hypothetical protein CHLRE_13g581700v5 [Chlamydomonas reinhardtii]|uniref:Polymerase nucleotidyl transferase domain-containing protein n=1 Tax=Chlamydomonas reinhardtii TaxID=3055 RepID=A0A2K3D0G1_CHLRE|nr:uncharacterized protein CHLRE_13g581700v5 [Chlamydomonas reinhardtii]PNW74011.1 hypothetical protein CHLRE_13g581700v5 [Chlamydomonas reinhardtii]